MGVRTALLGGAAETHVAVYRGSATGRRGIPAHSGEHLFEIIMRRHEVRSTIMTSNRPLEEWGKLLGDVPAAGAILDRFLQHAQVVTMAGRSYRLKDTPVAEPRKPSIKQETDKAKKDN